MITTVGGGKVWTPTAPNSIPNPPRNTSKVFKITKIFVQLFLSLAFIVFIYAYMSSTIKVTDEMSVSNWSGLTIGASFKAALSVGLMWFFIPAWAGIVAMIIPIGLKRGLLLFVALIAISEGFMLHAYQQGVVNVDHQAKISTWLEGKYNYELIDFVNGEGLESPDDRMTALVIDQETGEEKLVKYYDNNGMVYFAVDDNDFLQQIKRDARN